MNKLIVLAVALVGCATLPVRPEVQEPPAHENAYYNRFAPIVTKTLLGAGAISLSAPTSGVAISGTTGIFTGNLTLGSALVAPEYMVCQSSAATATSGIPCIAVIPGVALDATDLIFGIGNNVGTLGFSVSFDLKTHVNSDLVGGATSDANAFRTYMSSAGSGSNAFQVNTNGARVDFGAGANDYASSDGTTISTPAPFQAASYNLAGTAASAGCIGASGNDQICLAPNQMTISASGSLHIGSSTPFVNDALIGTAGSGTGISTSIAGTAAIRNWVDKVTVVNTALTAAASTDITIWTTLVNTKLIALTADVTQVFTGGALSAVTVQCGNVAGGTQYLLANSVFTAQTTWGDANAEIGLNLIPGNAAYAPFGTPSAGIPGAIAISCRFTCTGALCNAATQGSVTFEIEGVTYP